MKAELPCYTQQQLYSIATFDMIQLITPSISHLMAAISRRTAGQMRVVPTDAVHLRSLFLLIMSSTSPPTRSASSCCAAVPC